MSETHIEIDGETTLVLNKLVNNIAGQEGSNKNINYTTSLDANFANKITDNFPIQNLETQSVDLEKQNKISHGKINQIDAFNSVEKVDSSLKEITIKKNEQSSSDQNSKTVVSFFENVEKQDNRIQKELIEKHEIDKKTLSENNQPNMECLKNSLTLQTKRNVAVKNTSGGFLKQHNVINNKHYSQKQPVSNNMFDDDAMLDLDKDDNNADDESNDEYIPSKISRNELSDGSDLEVEGDLSVKRKSNRLLKKPKILDEYIIESVEESSIKNQLQDIDNIISPINSKIQTKAKSLEIQKLQESSIQFNSSLPKQFARKTTTPIYQSNQRQSLSSNIQNNHQSKKLTKQFISQVVTSSNYDSSIPLKQQHNSHLSNGNSQSAHKMNSIHSNRTVTSLSPVNTGTNNPSSQHITPIVKQYRNKIISCKPFCDSKATECVPIVKDASTQIDLDEIKLNHTIVPLPVPLNVPLPICMYQAPMPIPLLIPIPIPVPVFIPTTKKTFDRIERKIQKLRKKLPSDPYEFEILLYAEKLAREEGIQGFEDSSDGESESETSDSLKSNIKKNEIKSRDNLQFRQQQQQQQSNSIQENHEQNVQQNQFQLVQNEQEGSFKWIYGVKIFNTWLINKIDKVSSNLQRQPDDLLKLKNEELNVLLAEFINEIRKPSGEIYAPESVYYLCLGIQFYMQEKGRVENIFLDYLLFDKFNDALNEIALRYQIRINTEGQITSRIEEEILWESKQLGAFSPFVLLNTILYFNTKYFFLDKPESHLQLSFTNVKKHSKRNIGPNGEDFGKTVYLRYYPDFHGLEQVIYEQGENYDNPLRCPVELYNFYLSKCPENVKNRSDVFYLLPEKASLPSSPVWFSSQPLGSKMLEKMLNRIKMVREVNELLLAASPATTSTIIQ